MFLGYALIVIMQQRRFSELQKDIVNNLTHEFKTPLSSIVLSTEVLDDNDVIKEPDRIKNYSKIIKTQANYLLEHIEKVLGMSELENVGQLNKRNYNLHEFLCKLMDDIGWRVNDKNGQFSLDLKAKEYTICADEFHFTNLIVNLIDNSLKYCEKLPQILISTESDKKNIVLRFKDNGIGIDKSYHKKIFKKFFRIPTGNVHNVKGFGLGLSYVKNVIKGHRWKYRINSEPNKGTEFIIFIPFKDEDCE